MKGKRAACLAALLVWAMLLAPFFLGAPAAHPATDDFTFAAYTHPTWLQTHSLPHVVKDAVSYALRTWRDWQGTVTGVIVMALNPAVFGLRGYGMHAALLLLLQLAADYVFLRRMLGKRLGLSPRLWRAMFLLLSAVRLVFLPDMVEGIYWFNGAWFYTGAQAVSLIALALADAWSEACPAGRVRRMLCACTLSLALFALGMDNYITAMMTAAALALMALARAWAARGEGDKAAQRRAAKRTALLLLPLCAGLLLSVAAPGNAVRMAADGAHESGAGYALLSCARTAWAAVGYIVRFTLRTPLLALLSLLAPALCAGPRRSAPPAAATAFGFYLALCAMIVPHMYASGYAGSGRVVNMYHGYVLFAAPIAATLMLRRLPDGARAWLQGARGRGACRAVALAAAVVCLLGGQLGGYIKLVRDQWDGTQAAYIAQFQSEYALCEAAGLEDDVALPAWTVQTVTGKPTAYEDATVWTNEAMAHYFGVRSVYVSGAGE